MQRRSWELMAIAPILCAVFTACGGGGAGGNSSTPTGPTGCQISSVSVGPETTSVVVGETRDLLAAFAGVNCTSSQTVTWSDANTAALALQADGNTAHVTGRVSSAQPVTVTASIGGKSASSQVTVLPPPTIKLAPETLTFTALRSGPSPQSQSVAITNGGGGTLDNLSVGATTYGGGASDWLLVQSNNLNPTAPTSLNVVPTNTTLADGSYTATVPIVSPKASNSPANITVVYTITGGANVPSISNLSATLAGVNACTQPSGVPGNIYNLSFSFSSSSGAGFTGTIIQTFVFVPGGSVSSGSRPVPSAGVTVSATTMSFADCLTFGNATAFNYAITLQNAAGQQSNVLQGVLTKPAGGSNTGPPAFAHTKPSR
jgi:hypothetical protein